jgi:hypothetical protein
MTGSDSDTPARDAKSKAARRAAREAVGAYHEAQLAALLEHVRDGITRHDAGEIDAFELDELIHHYKRSTQKLWTFCVGTGRHVESAAKTIDFWTAEGDLPDWWEIGAPHRRRGS